MPAVNLKEIATEKLVIFHRDGAPATYDRIVSFCVDAGFEPIISHAVHQWFTIIALVSEGIGVALVPARMARSGFANVSFVPIRSQQSLTSTGYLLWNPKKASPCLSLLRVIVAEIGDGPEEAVA
jgi:DNA-binding transcriptional LysR family regulator